MSTVLDGVNLESALDFASSPLASPRLEPEGSILLGLDIGTSGVRAVLFDEHGKAIAGSEVGLSNSLHLEIGGGADASTDTLADLTFSVLDLLVARAGSFVSRIDYVSVSCFWHSLLGVDKAGQVSTPLFGWAETRAAEAVRQLRAALDEKTTHNRTGCRFHPSYWPAKLIWLRSERKDLFARTAHWLSFSDYLWLRLFGEPATSISMASATGLFDQRSCEWDRELLEFTQLDPEQVAAVAEPAQTFQGLQPEHADRWPILTRAAWFPAIGDGAANNLGAGCVSAERIAVMVGTSGAMRIVCAGVPPETLPPEVFCYRADRDRVVIGGALSDGGGLIRWLKEGLALELLDEQIEAALGEIKPDSHGLTLLPFWSGERSTGWSTKATGAITGLASHTRPIEILRAAMEAICYRFALLARALQPVAPAAEFVGAGNALLASPTWAQMLADVLGRPLKLSQEHQASCRGAALLALESIGKISTIESAAMEFGQSFEPDPKRHQIYQQAIQRQQDIYTRLAEN